MILLDKITQRLPEVTELLKASRDEPTIMRVHHDVFGLAADLVVRDRDKLLASMDTAFFPAEVTWLEWEMGPNGEQRGGTMGLMFAGTPDVRTGNLVYYSWKDGDAEPWCAIPVKVNFADNWFHLDLENLVSREATDPIRLNEAWTSTIQPMVLAILALVNAPKIVRRRPAKVDKINRKRKAAGKYTFHPHHTVRLNIDRKSIDVQEGSGGDGASRALHMVRAHLRLWNGRYILVRPHWRGDPQVGIRKTSYEVDRTGSRWAE